MLQPGEKVLVEVVVVAETGNFVLVRDAEASRHEASLLVHRSRIRLTPPEPPQITPADPA